MHRSVALLIVGSLALGGLCLAEPATAQPIATSSTSSQKTCRDPAAVRHSKHRLRVTVNDARDRYRDQIAEAQDQLKIDQLRAQNDLARSWTTAAEKALDQARIDQDKNDVSAYSEAFVDASNDSAYLKRCSVAVLTKGTRRVAKHALLLEMRLLRSTLIGQTGTLAYDEGEYRDALAGEDPLEIAQARAAVREDQNAINRTRDELDTLVQQIRDKKY